MHIEQILENRIAELETKIAFQEQLLDELNHALVQQQILQAKRKKRHHRIINFCNKFVQMKRAHDAPFKLNSQIIIS